MTRLVAIAAALEHAGLLLSPPPADRSTWPDITGVTADTRRLEPGMLFCAIRGAAMDGHRFVADAARAGAIAALVEEPLAAPVLQFVVRDGRRAAAVAAETWYGRPASRLHLVAVTGTNGKTTSVILCRHVLSAIEPTGSIGTLGAFDPAGRPIASEAGNLTTPGPIDLQATLAALVQHGARGAVMEASSHSLDQGRIDGLVFRAAIFTNLTRDHLDYHGTLEAYFKAKARLLEYLAPPPDGIAVVNADDPAWAALPLANGRRRITFGETAADVMARGVEVDARGSRFTLVTPAGAVAVALPLLGRFNVSNALGVAACAVGLDVPLAVIGERLTHAPQVPGRMERLATRPCVVLRDYAHTPDALERALQTVRPLARGRVIVVFGAGGDRDRGKRAPMGAIAARLADLAIATSDNPRREDPERILDEVEAGMAGVRHERMADRRAAIALALDRAHADDVVLLAGKGHETYQILGTEKVPFDEREIVRQLGAS